MVWEALFEATLATGLEVTVLDGSDFFVSILAFCCSSRTGSSLTIVVGVSVCS